MEIKTETSELQHFRRPLPVKHFSVKLKNVYRNKKCFHIFMEKERDDLNITAKWDADLFSQQQLIK